MPLTKKQLTQVFAEHPLLAEYIRDQDTRLIDELRRVQNTINKDLKDAITEVLMTSTCSFKRLDDRVAQFCGAINERLGNIEQSMATRQRAGGGTIKVMVKKRLGLLAKLIARAAKI